MAPQSPVIVTSDPHLLAQWRYDERRRWPDPQEPAAQAAGSVLGRHTDRVEIRSAAEVSALTESARTIAETAPPVLRAGLLDLASRITVASAPLTAEGEPAAAGADDDWLSRLDARIAAPGYAPAEPAHAEAPHAEPAYAEPAHADVSFAEPAHADAAYAEPAADHGYDAPSADVVGDWADELAGDAPAADAGGWVGERSGDAPEDSVGDWADELTGDAPAAAADDAFYVPPTADADPVPAAPWEMAEAAEAAADAEPADDAFYIPPAAAAEPPVDDLPWESAAASDPAPHVEPEAEPEVEAEPWAIAPPAVPEARSDLYAAAPEARSDLYAADPTPQLVPAMHIAPAAEEDAPPPLPEIALFAPAVAPHPAPEPEPAAVAAPEPVHEAPPAPAPQAAAAPAPAPAGGAAEALASLGAGMGMTVTGRGREGTDAELAEMDVVWMQGGKVVAVFVVDPAPLLDGVLRVSDMLAARPGIHLPFYFVAPESARAELRAQAHRPTFGRLNPPLADAVRFLGRETLDASLAQVTGFLRYLRPEFIESLAEPLG